MTLLVCWYSLITNNCCAEPINVGRYVSDEYYKDETYTKNPNFVPYSLEMPDYTELKFD